MVRLAYYLGEGQHLNDLEATAEKAQLTGQIRSFMIWLGEGRKLTRTGRIGLADARQLVELLGTGDKIDPEIGSRVFQTKSSEELAYLTRLVEWMKAARLVRVTGTRLVPVKKNATLPSRPFDLVLTMLAPIRSSASSFLTRAPARPVLPISAAQRPDPKVVPPIRTKQSSRASGQPLSWATLFLPNGPGSSR